MLLGERVNERLDKTGRSLHMSTMGEQFDIIPLFSDGTFPQMLQPV
jgi:hypothetical protein